MNFKEFVNKVCDTGIEGAKESYKDRPNMLKGSIAGFEACRDLKPDQMLSLLKKARGEAAYQMMQKDIDLYWEHTCFANEVEWVVNCVSAVLMNEGKTPIGAVTSRGLMHANDILQGKV